MFTMKIILPINSKYIGKMQFFAKISQKIKTNFIMRCFILSLKSFWNQWYINRKVVMISYQTLYKKRDSSFCFGTNALQLIGLERNFKTLGNYLVAKCYIPSNLSLPTDEFFSDAGDLHDVLRTSGCTCHSRRGHDGKRPGTNSIKPFCHCKRCHKRWQDFDASFAAPCMSNSWQFYIWRIGTSAKSS